jgi:hypothetical protein
VKKINLLRLQKSGCFFLLFSTISKRVIAVGRFLELGPVCPSGKTATCRWRKIRTIDAMVFTGAKKRNYSVEILFQLILFQLIPFQCHFFHHKSHIEWPGIETGPPI